MSLAVRTINLTGEYYVDLHTKDVSKQLYSLGFIQEKGSGNWIPPKIFLLHETVKKGITILPPDINKWHEVHFSSFIDEKRNKRKLIKLLYKETVSIRYGKYEFENSTKLYGKDWFKEDKKLYQVYLSSPINTFEEWLKFPFKTKFGYIPEFQMPIPDRLSRNQSFLISTIKELINKKSEIEDKELYLEILSQDRFRPRLVLDKLADNKEVFEMINWFSFFCYELLMDLNSNLKINICNTCHGIITLSDKDHSDRTHHKKNESLECWQKQERERKRKQRI